jgi:hypothetical protein
MNPRVRLSLTFIWVAGLLTVEGCGPPKAVPKLGATPAEPNADPVPALTLVASNSGRPQVEIEKETEAGSISVRLPDPKVSITQSAATKLSARETAALLKRLEPLPDLSEKNLAAPVVRAPTAAPPRAGRTLPITFVAPTGKAVSDAPIAPAKVTSPLVAPQITPQGEVRQESVVRVRFDEPMVKVSRIGIADKVPVTITPSTKGTWRWLDTRVLTFTASSSRLPAATEFVVTVPAGTRAPSGATLTADEKVKFATGAVEIAGQYPATVVRPDSAIAIKFDQGVDASALLPFLRVVTPKGKPLVFKTISLAAAEGLWKKNPAITTDALLGADYLILAPETVWPSGSEVRVLLKKGAPSKEGPRVTVRESLATFEVAPPFTVKGVTCDETSTPRLIGALCPANGQLDVHFSNSIETQSFRSSKVQIEAEEFQDESPSGSVVGLIVPEKVGRLHHVAIGEGLVDIYGQPLTGDKWPAFTTSQQRFYSYLSAPTGVHVLDPRFQIPQWVVNAEAVSSVRIQLFQVQPKDFFAYEDYESDKRGTPPGKCVIDKSYTIGPRGGANIRVDLRPALGSAGVGNVVAIATAVPISNRPSFEFDRKSLAWIQVTRLGLSARMDREKVSGWIHNIAPSRLLQPMADVTASLLIEGRPDVAISAVSDASGHVAFDLAPPAKPRDVTALLLAQSSADSTFMAIRPFEKAIREQNALWYVTDDRFLYKPGEQVYVKGWVRWTHNGVNPAIALPAPGDVVDYTLNDSRGVRIGNGTAKLSDQGGFDLQVTLPQNVNLGHATFNFETKQARHSHPISIEEFRRPAYSVTLNDDVSHAGAAPLILGESIEMNASAKYYSGGGLGGALIQWDAKLAAASYRPPGWDLFYFFPARKSRRFSYSYTQNEPEVSTHKAGTLSGASSAGVVFGITALPANGPSLLDVDATVTDLDRMTIRASSRSILVHPSAYYVGIREKPATRDMLELVVTDIDGNAVRDVPVTVEIEGVLGSERYREDAKIIDKQACNIKSAAAAAICSFKRLNDNTAYFASATVFDPRGRPNVTQYAIPWYAATEKKTDFAVIPDKAMYRVGDKAKLEIQSTVLPATAVVTFARQGMIAQKRLELTTPSSIIELPIEPGYVQNLYVVVDRWGKRRHLDRGSNVPLPEHTSVEVNIPVDIESARLEMKTRPTRALVEPGENATFEVEIRHDGKAKADAEVALIVVDEAVLALSGKSHADPLAPFYRRVDQGTTHESTIDMVRDSGDVLAGDPGFALYKLNGLSGLGGGGRGQGFGLGGIGTVGHGAGTGSGIVSSRKDFRANAAFSPMLKTDANGRVALTVKMPESLTRFRVIALATANGRLFGKAESVIVTQRMLNARSIAPRFLTQGDSFSLPVLVQNLGVRPRTVDVAVRAANLVARGPSGQRVTIPGGQRAEVRFDFSTEARGRAIIQTIAAAENFADASSVEVPVFEPATTESFATYGTVDDAAQFEQLVVPTNVFQDVGGVEVEIASSQLQSLTDAYWYLYAYPYECAEQRSSRMLATAAIYDILDAFETPGRPKRAEIEAMRANDARVLGKDQQPDGGWGYFHGMKSDPFVTTQVLQALSGQRVAEKVTGKAVEYVSKRAAALFAELERSAATPLLQRKDRDHQVYIVSLAASTLTALAAAGVHVQPRAAHLHALASALGAYPVDAKARLLSLVAKHDRYKAMRAQLLSELLSVTHETASSATVTVGYVEAERLLLVSNNKSSALVLDALLRERPEHNIIAKLARGVLDGRRRGRWNSTQESLVAVQALRRYFDTFEKATPNYTGKLWFGTTAYAEQSFVGRSNSGGQTRLDWHTLVPGSTHDLTLVKSGTGRMYYRIGVTYAPGQANLPALDAGFIVRRSYTGADDPADVTKLADGRWKIRLGAKVIVTLEILNTTLRHNVALVDPLPAGFETINERLATAERAAKVVNNFTWDYENLRDNRSEAFAMSMGEGSHRLSYTARATTPGIFIAAPAKAEEMYTPETFGRSSGEVVVVE